MGKVAMDKLRRRLFAEKEVQRLALKSIALSTRLPRAVRLAATTQLAALPANTSATRIRSRCILSGRARAVNSQLRLSRIEFRRLASDGELPGIWKAR